MKLEFESNAATLPLVDHQDINEIVSDSNSPEVTKMLREGIEAAQSGNRAEARTLLLRVTEADDKNENAWLWLASISEYPEELLVFLKNVLSINPKNERAIEWAKATEQLMAKTFVQRGIDAAKNNQKDLAKQCFLQGICHDNKSELAWLWLASVSDSPEEKVSHLHKVLSINPDNENALSSLKSAKTQMAKSLLPKANNAAISGKREESLKLLDEILNDAPDCEDAWMLKAHLAESFEEKIAYFEQVLEVNSDNQVARANIDSLKMILEQSANQDEDVDEFDIDAYEVSDELENESSEESMDHSLKNSDEAQEFSSEDVVDDVQQNEEEVPEVEMQNDEYEVEDNSQDTIVQEDDSQEVELQLDNEDQPSEEHLEEVEEQVFTEESEVDPVYEELEEEPTAFEEEEPAVLEEEYVSPEVNFEEVLEEEEHFAHSENEMEEVSFDEPVVSENGYQLVMPTEEMEMSSEEEYLVEDSYQEEPLVEETSISEPEMPQFAAQQQEVADVPYEYEEKQAVTSDCPFCHVENDSKVFVCGSCKAVLTLSDMDMLLLQENAESEVIQKSIDRMEADKKLRGVDVDELRYMGIGYINLKKYRKGFEYLQEVARKDPNDMMLASHIDTLAIRISEIEQQKRTQRAQPKSKTILVVDDSPTVRKLISGKLEKCGHEAICAVDGMDALAKINDVVPDLILLDITMPRMDGYQVCKLIRGNDATKEVPVVMISGKDGFFDKVRGKMAGTNDYITKPFGPETLMKMVNEYIS